MRFFLELDGPETRALSMLAGREYRDVRKQAALIIKQELIRRGLLQPSPPLHTELKQANNGQSN